MGVLLRDGRRSRSWRTGAAVLAAGLVVTGCGADSGDAKTPDASVGNANAELSSLLPDNVRERGYITIAGDASYPPINSFDKDGTTMIGVDPDLAKALGEKLGIELRYENSAFDAIIPGIQGEKFEAAMSWMNDTDERRQIVDFVDYSSDGSSMFVPADSEHRPETLADLCGLKVAVQKGSVQQSDAQKANEDCQAAGDKPVDVQVYPDQIACNLALTSGRAEVSIADTPVAGWQVKESDGKFALSGGAYGRVYHGVALPKGSAMVEPFARAFEAIMKDGSYQEILEKWGLGDAAIPEPLINGEPLD
jgi:polar amino acid transport system substrate-binding protein